MLKVGSCAQKLGITAGNSHTVLHTHTFHVKRIEHCFGDHRISNDTVMTFKIGELSQFYRSTFVDCENYLHA